MSPSPQKLQPRAARRSHCQYYPSRMRPGVFDGLTVPVRRGATWTTDGPFRETPAAIEAARRQGLLAVEMEAAGLYAFGRARARSVVCFAHVTSRMGTTIGDFEKGRRREAATP